MKPSPKKEGSILHSTAPAWGEIRSAVVGGGFGVREGHYIERPGESKSQHTWKEGISSEAETDGDAEAPQTQRHPSTPQEQNVISASAQELDRTRVADLEADRSHIKELRTLVVEFTLQGCGQGSREVFMADLLVQVRGARPMLAVDDDIH